MAVAAAVLAGGAAAFWLVLGNGSTGSQAGTVSAVTLAPAATSTPLFPGGTADVAVSVVNGNPGRIFVGSLLLDTGQGTSGFSVDGGHSGCNLAALGYTTQTNGGSGWSVPGSSTLPLDLSGAVSLSTSAVSACQGAQVTVYLQVGS
ncbi:MAG: hypothetical protein ACXVRJ_04835 [Gaiellaceae bacterium]